MGERLPILAEGKSVCGVKPNARHLALQLFPDRARATVVKNGDLRV